MSGLLNSSLNGSASNVPDGAGRSFATSFSGQSGAASPVFHHSGLHNIHGSFNIQNMSGALASRNSTINNVPSGGVQQPTGTLSSGRYAASNNLPVALSQLSHGGSHGHLGVANRGGISVVGNPGFSSSTNAVGGSIPGILSSSAGIGNRNTVPGLGVSPILGNSGPRITTSMGNMVSGGNIGRSITSGGGLSLPGLASRLNLGANSGSGSLSVQGQNRLMSGVLPQGSQQVISMLGNSYPSAGGPLSQNHMQSVNSLSSLGMLNDVNANDNSPFDINDFPQLTSRPSSAGGPQGQLSSLRKQGLSPIVQQNQEFSIQNEDFPALPRFKGGNADYGMDMHQTEQHENSVPMMQSQQFSIGRSAGFSLGSTYTHRPQQQQQHSSAVSNSTVSFSPANNQDLLHLHGSDIFPSSHTASYHQQSSGPPGIGLRPMSSPNSASGMGYDQLIQQYQQHHGQSQFRFQSMSGVNQSFRDQGIKSMQTAQSSPDPFGLLGLLSVIRLSDPDLASLALGIDLTTLGLNLNSAENLHKTFGSPWSDEPAKGDPDFNVPQCYLIKPPPTLHQGYFSKFTLETLFYIFFSMPKDEAQLYAANELYNRGWFYHKEQRFWFIRVSNMEPLVKTNTHERGSYLCFDPQTFETVRKDNFVLHYEMVEKRPALPQH
ncbi:probable NOT transcription complex subunit VIP2 isoform X2 [Cucurbita pepo subsp. pepo]|uniref:Probable NOT transcription complex subunit VIP2 isoform X2 n=1 Tax=Cucurbita moschata TaxID=3662 RepID=A0A6J1FU31_CUCMO|nr:probable NOT transcription complex subunit VIP2 isoform X2 [Cucurbita moschata]XP_023511947.1 probable NOT transcription complex subunit VIP2 isoform X2 [Cucurbita pepo subsp. pepo]